MENGMPRKLYFQKILFNTGATLATAKEHSETSFGVQPRNYEHDQVSCPVSLKNDLKWHEVKNLQNLMRKADFWNGFIEEGTTLITAEVKAGREPQRIDLLYLRADGGVFPCELKVGGADRDAHGQIIRYLADLSQQPISKDWVLEQRTSFLARKSEKKPRIALSATVPVSIASRRCAKVNSQMDLDEFRSRTATIPYDGYRLLQNMGIIIDEDFPLPLRTAVAFLNREFHFDLRLYQLNAFVKSKLSLANPEYIMRLEIADVTPRLSNVGTVGTTQNG